jgi:hypothetical protein
VTAVRGGALIVAAAAVLLLAACGGSGSDSSQLSPSAYRAQLVKVKRELAGAQAGVAQGVQAKSLRELRLRLDAFAEVTQRIGDEVAKLQPPTNAESANAELASGLHETARAARAASAAVAGMHTTKAAIAYLEHQPANAKGAHQEGSALTRLQQLGYVTSG